MPTYISLVNYTDQGIRNVKDSPKRLDAAKKLLKDMGGEMKAFYLTMGAYDIVTVAEAPNDESVAKFVLALASSGNVRTTTMKAFPEADYRKLIAGLP
ncbi:MAG: GYD domain-containing protein [Candidatus Rokubacteria bacterium]|nr:GYD domain-containing protein [Candidatus Rokubacteria bacterium]